MIGTEYLLPVAEKQSLVFQLPAVTGDRVVFESVDTQIAGAVVFTSVDAATGREVGDMRIDVSADTSYQFGVADGRLFASASGSGLRAFDLIDGSSLWSDPPAPQGAIRNVGGRLYLNSFGRVASYDPSGCGARTCQPAWVTPAEPSIPPAGEVGYSQAAITANTIVIEASSNAPDFATQIYYYSAVTGQLIGQTSLPRVTDPHPPIITPGLVWVVENHAVVVLPESCANSCQPLQTYDTLHTLQPYIQIAGGTVLLLTVNEDGAAISALR